MSLLGFYRNRFGEVCARPRRPPPNCERHSPTTTPIAALGPAGCGLVTIDVGGCHRRRVVDCGSCEQSEGVFRQPGPVTDYGAARSGGGLPKRV